MASCGTCKAPPPGFRAPVLQSQRAMFLAAGLSAEAYSERLLHLRHLGCHINALVTPPPSEDAPVLFAVHGWGAGLATYAFSLLELAKHYAVYLIDLPGMGASDRCHHWAENRDGTEEPDRSIDFFIQHLDACFATLVESDKVFASASRRRHLLAHSLGAYLSTVWMLRSPQNFATLSLASPVGVPERPVEGSTWEDAGPLQRLVFGIIKRLWALGVTPQSALRSVPRRSAERTVERMTARRYGQYLGQSTLGPLSNYFLEISRAPPSTEQSFRTILEPGAWARRPLLPLLPALKCKTSFAYGENDWMDKTVAEQACSSMLDASVAVVSGADHNVHMTAPREFALFVVQSAV